MQVNLKNLTFLLVLQVFLIIPHGTDAANCEIIPPDNIDGNEIGFIFVPGAQIKGEAYGPLSRRIQENFPGSLWIGLTEGWFGNFPNPLEVDGAIRDCFSKAGEAGLSTSKVFQAGHSLGGIVLETWANDNADLSSGIILFGSYLPNGFFGNGDTNVFPVPVLTAMGALDGGALSYVTREAREAQNPLLEGKYPVFVIDRVNHAQVASGTIPQTVIDNDVDAEIDNDEAFNRYAAPTVAFIVVNSADNFDPEIVAQYQKVLDDHQIFTDAFLEPFQMMKIQEQTLDNKESPWVIEGQKILSGAADGSFSVTTEIVEFSDLGDFKPQITSDGNCHDVTVTTCGYNSYPIDPLDFGGLISADVTKSKFKLEDVILDNVCSETPVVRNQCRDVNVKAFELALSIASEEARTRYLTQGRQLLFGDDSVSPWGPGWEFVFGLTYKTVNNTHVEVVSRSLISEPDFFIPSAAGMHYCDLLSPYRALEWIYIRGVQHGYKQFIL